MGLGFGLGGLDWIGLGVIGLDLMRLACKAVVFHWTGSDWVGLAVVVCVIELDMMRFACDCLMWIGFV